MPIYEYRCGRCSFQKEYLQKVSDPPHTVCPECGAESFSKMLTAAGFQLKGSGWYVTDFRSNGSAPAAKSDAEKSGNGKADAEKSDAAKSDTGGTESAKSGDSKSTGASTAAAGTTAASSTGSSSGSSATPPAGTSSS